MVIFVEEGVGTPARDRPGRRPRVRPRRTVGRGRRGAVAAHSGEAQAGAAAAAAPSDDAAAHVVLPLTDLVDRVAGVGAGQALIR